jgi:predicted metalloprotease with PDZ domain
MTFRPLRNSAWLAALVFVFSARPAAATIDYRVSLKNPEQHVFHVSMQVPVPAHEKELVVAIPAWNALYQVLDFGYRVRDVHASSPASGAPPLHVRKLDKQTWRVSLSPAGARSVGIDYAIEWNDAGPFNSQLNIHHAFVNFAEVLMYLPDRRGEDVTVKFEDVPAGWQSVAELPAGSAANSYTAESYDKLVDAPTEIGTFEQFGFDVNGAHFRVVVDAKEWRRDRLESYLRRITEYETKLMGGAPFKQYTFFFHFGPYPEVGGGGMEHANCTAIAAGSMEGAGTIAAHEFFHAWNVKRIRPQTLEPVDFTKEQYTRALWFAEGVTSTYGAYTLERSGIWPKDEFYGDLAAQISELDSRPARLWQSVEESSLDAWLEKYDEYRRPERSISYYNKGQIDGVMLDFAIRDATDNRKSLDDLLRRMFEDYAKQGKFYNDSEDIRAAAEEVAGTSFADFFEHYVAGTDEIPYDKFLNAAGLALKVEMRKAPDLGFWTVGGRTPGSVVTVSQVEPGSAAESAGLRPGDVLLELNGAEVPRFFPGWLRDRSPGDTLKLRLRRDAKEIEVSFALGTNEEKKYSVAEIAHPTDKQKRIREGWLRGTTN